MQCSKISAHLRPFHFNDSLSFKDQSGYIMCLDIIDKPGNCLDVIIFDYMVSDKCFQFQPFQ